MSRSQFIKAILSDDSGEVQAIWEDSVMEKRCELLFGVTAKQYLGWLEGKPAPLNCDYVLTLARAGSTYMMRALLTLATNLVEDFNSYRASSEQHRGFKFLTFEINTSWDVPDEGVIPFLSTNEGQAFLLAIKAKHWDFAELLMTQEYLHSQCMGLIEKNTELQKRLLKTQLRPYLVALYGFSQHPSRLSTLWEAFTPEEKNVLMYGGKVNPGKGMGFSIRPRASMAARLWKTLKSIPTRFLGRS